MSSALAACNGVAQRMKRTSAVRSVPANGQKPFPTARRERLFSLSRDQRKLRGMLS